MNVIVESTLEMHALFKANVERLQKSAASLAVQWIKPLLQTLILNYDGAISKDGSGRGGGCCCDYVVNFLCGFMASGPPGLDVLGTKLEALREGLLMMGFKSLTCFVVALESKEAMSRLKDVVHQPRLGNRVAHALAQFGLKESTRFFWEDVAPPWLVARLRHDLELG
ncbi:PREDICTED: PRUPE_3G181300 [Prunus dulcis]|uniref:PREDICTED: PRUPE_3G181300 n=1 Tax=Prunus dulcis TaxID=3755 RepID=A0A5E4GK50_PRUDU|nr:PREDICTED: PRUPE_3G181300 [Prunus dulcis]